MDIETLAARVEEALKHAKLTDKRRFKREAKANEVVVTCPAAFPVADVVKALEACGLTVWAHTSFWAHARLDENQGLTLALTHPGMKDPRTIEVRDLVAVRRVLEGPLAREYTQAVISNAQGDVVANAMRGENRNEGTIDTTWSSPNHQLQGAERLSR
jgi:hypothetical protein